MNDASTTSSGPLSADAFSRVDISEQGKYSQVKRPDGNGSEWVLRSTLPPDTPSPQSSPSGLQRPDWAPESVWDAKTGLNHDAFGKHFAEKINPILTRDAAEQVRRNTLPASPDKYDTKVSPALKLPDDAKPELDPADPMWGKAKAWAHKHGLSQHAFEEAVDLVVSRDTVSAQQFQRARDGELRKLGAGAKVRMDAIEGFYTDLLGKDMAKAAMSRIWTSDDVIRAEKVVARFKGQGVSPVREPGLDDATWATKSPGEKYNYAKAHSNAPR
jgi:hypothetical protein